MCRLERVLFLIIGFSVVSYQKSSPESTFYIAAVVEYSPVSEVGDDGMTGLVTQNVYNYIQFIEDASRQGADVIVFPEVGLISYGKDMYASPMADPQDHANPCTNSTGMLNELSLLSCAARNNSIYVVINFPEVKVCNESEPGTDCVHRGTFHYNSDLVFDRKGYIVARYRKYNLFYEPGFNRTPTPEMSTFKTDFGVKFGLITCFDILFKAPAVALVRQLNVTDVIMPLAWFSELPFLTALQTQSQWSYAMDVNLLAAGYNKPSVGSTGSGIYNGKNGPLVTLFTSSNISRLLIANVPKKVSTHDSFEENNVPSQHEIPHEHLLNVDRNSLQPVCAGNNFVSHYTHVDECAGDENMVSDMLTLHLMQESLSNYTTLPLNVAKMGSVQNVSERLCSDSICCDFTIQTSLQPSPSGQLSSEVTPSSGSSVDESSSGNIHYRMVVYSGMRSYGTAADAGIQVCGIVSCESESLNTCGLPPRMTNIVSPIFNHITITGSFNASNAVQMPNAITLGYKVIKPQLYLYANVLEGQRVNVTLQSKGNIDNLLTFGIYGRYFDNDALH